MNGLKRAIEISRPIFWPSTFLTFLTGVVFSGSEIDVEAILFACLWAFPYSLWICSVNDYYDFDTDKINQFKGKLSGAKPKLTEKRFLIFLAIASLLAIMIPTVLFASFASLLWSLSAIIVVFLYSSPPVRLKTRPIIDSLSNGIFVASVFLTGYFHNANISTISNSSALAAIAFVLGVSAIHILGALRDYTPDKTTGITTVAIFLGQKKSALLAANLFLLLFIISFKFPLEYRIFALYGFICCSILTLKPDEKLTVNLGLTLLLGFFLAAAFSIISESWESFL